MNIIKKLFKPKCLKEEKYITDWNKVNTDVYQAIYDDPMFGEHERLYVVDNKKKCVIGSCEINTETYEILDLYIKPEYRRHGYGYKLLRSAIIDYGCNNLSVYKVNIPAINLYRKLGFEVVSENDVLCAMKIKFWCKTQHETIFNEKS